MKAVKLLGNKKAITVDVPVQKIEDGYCLIKVVEAGICGTDLELLFNSKDEVKYIPGHEVVGTVVKKKNVDEFQIGDRVLINMHITCMECNYCKREKRIFCKQLKVIGFDLDGADAEYIALPKMCLIKIPDDISFDQAILLTDALGTPYAAAKKANIRPNDNVAVIGIGPLGLMCCLSAKYFGGKVFAIDIVPERLKQALNFGIDHVINPNSDDIDAIVKKFTNDGFDIVIECSGSAKGVKSAFKYVRPEGKIIQVGVCPSVDINTYDEWIAKEITIIGSRGYVDSQVGELADFIRKNPNITKAITHRFPLEKAQEAFDTANSKSGIKVIFTP
jgi:2-desacetyl-2-hydroxyethyl bacteriochlorophyllide A dehydrogenase